LSLLSAPLNVHVLTALSDEELPLAELSRAVGHPPATTMRSYLKGLADLGVAERRQEGGFPGAVAYALTPAGERLLLVASSLQSWLAQAPEGPAALGEVAAKSAVKALIEGWNATIVRALAARPLALTELAKLITSISYPTLERRVGAMRRTGQLRAARGDRASRGNPYELTHWLRRAAAPLAAAVAWEREWAVAQTRPMGRIDIESLFLLAIPLLELPMELSGRCRLAVEARPRPQREYAGAMVIVEAGKVVSSVARLEADSDGWAVGTAGSWLGWMSGERDSALEFGGDIALIRPVVDALHQVLIPGSQV
jgi:DNA-binding HxlR family transcriptional regulator